MDFTHNIVTFYGGAIVMLAGSIAWYIRQYILTNGKNTRLALFSHRNPKPILSVYNLGELIFSNPACDTRLLSQGYFYSRPLEEPKLLEFMAKAQRTV